jgi:hypothetical protein
MHNSCRGKHEGYGDGNIFSIFLVASISLTLPLTWKTVAFS